MKRDATSSTQAILLRPLLADDQEEDGDRVSSLTNETISGDNCADGHQDKEEEEEEKEALITPKKLFVILLNVCAGSCLLAALLQYEWLVSRNGNGIRAGLDMVCVNADTLRRLNESRSRIESHLPFASPPPACAEWKRLQTSYSVLVTDSLLNSLGKTKKNCIVSCVFSYTAAVMLIVARVVKKFESASGFGGVASLLAGIFAIMSLSAISDVRVELADTESRVPDTGGSIGLLAASLRLIVYGYCLGLALVASVCSIASTALTMD